MLRTFNCGIGMIAVVEPRNAGEVAAVLRREGETVVTLGEVVETLPDAARVSFTGHLGI